jgi:hypothetical protein
MDYDLSPVVNPLDRALAAISDAITDLLTSNQPGRFAKIATLAKTACQLQRQRPAANVDEVLADDGGDDEVNDFGFNPRQAVMPRRGFNDGADLTREIVMLGQNVLKSYMEAEQKKASQPKPDTRLNEVMELSELTLLRVRMMKDDQPVPEQIDQRVNQLLQRIGEPPHVEPQPSSLVHPEPIWGHSPNSAGQPDGDRVGEPVTE